MVSVIREMQQEAAATRRQFGKGKGEQMTVADRVDKEFFVEPVDGVDWYVDLATGAARIDLPKGARIVDKPAIKEEVDALALAETDAETEADLMEELAKPLPLNWIAEVGSKIAGTVISRYLVDNEMEGSGNKDGTAWALEIETASGAVFRVVAFHTTLTTAIRRLNPTVGDRIAIQRLTDVESKIKGHQPYQNFRVVVRPAPGR